MTVPPFLRFTPVPVKSRHDGWSPDLQMHFVVALARGFSINRAARLVGKTRTTAYTLRQRPRGESFAAAWDAALAYAKRARMAAAAARPAAPAAPRPAPAATPAEAAARRRAAEAVLARFYREGAGQAAKAGEASKAGKADGGVRDEWQV